MSYHSCFTDKMLFVQFSFLQYWLKCHKHYLKENLYPSNCATMCSSRPCDQCLPQGWLSYHFVGENNVVKPFENLNSLILQEIVAMLSLKAGQKVLDVGCGIGGSGFYMVKVWALVLLLLLLWIILRKNSFTCYIHCSFFVL